MCIYNFVLLGPIDEFPFVGGRFSLIWSARGMGPSCSGDQTGMTIKVYELSAGLHVVLEKK